MGTIHEPQQQDRGPIHPSLGAAHALPEVRAPDPLESIEGHGHLRPLRPGPSGQWRRCSLKVPWPLIRALFGCAGVLFLYAAFLGHRELYVPSWRAAGILFLAITGAVLFHEAIR